MFDFGPFRLDTQRSRLTRGGDRISLPLKAFEILQLLVEARGDLVHRDTFQKSLWPDTAVEERNLTVQISVLRRALKQAGGDGCIETIPGRGYRLATPVTVTGEGGAAPSRQDAIAPVPEPARRADQTARGERGVPYILGLAVALAIAVMATGVAVIYLARDSGSSHTRRLQMEAHALLDRIDRQGTFAALELFQRAVALTPTAAAHAGVGAAYLQLSSTRIGRPLRLADGTRLAREAADHALALDPRNPEAYALLGQLAFYAEWDWPGAQAAFQEAARLGPEAPHVHLAYGQYLIAMGLFDEGLAALEHARTLNLVRRRFAEVLGYMQFVAGRPADDALRLLSEAVRLDPVSARPHVYRVRMLDQMLRQDEATAARRDWATASGGFFVDRPPPLAETGGYAVMTERWATSMRELDSWWDVAHAEIALGRPEAAVVALERCVAERCTSAPFLGVEPGFVALHGTEPFERLVSQMGLQNVRGLYSPRISTGK